MMPSTAPRPGIARDGDRGKEHQHGEQDHYSLLHGLLLSDHAAAPAIPSTLRSSASHFPRSVYTARAPHDTQLRQTGPAAEGSTCQPCSDRYAPGTTFWARLFPVFHLFSAVLLASALLVRPA